MTTITDERMAKIKAGLEGVSEGPWEENSERSDGCYGSGDDCHEGYNTSVLLDAKGRKIADALNSDVGMISEECDEDGCYAWDDQAKKNFKHMARMDPETVASLIARVEVAEKRVKVLEEAVGPFAAYADTWFETEPAESVLLEGYDYDPDITLAVFRRARAALKGGA